MLGLLDDGYDGKIYYGEKSVSDEAQKTNIRRKHIAFIFQEYNLINSLTVKENVQTAVDISEGVLDEEVYSNIISMFKLNNLENRDVATLSGGEKQRVAIARALVRNNEIILPMSQQATLMKKIPILYLMHLKRLQRIILL